MHLAHTDGCKVAAARCKDLAANSGVTFLLRVGPVVVRMTTSPAADAAPVNRCARMVPMSALAGVGAAPQVRRVLVVDPRPRVWSCLRRDVDDAGRRGRAWRMGQRR